ncbi:MAG: protein translocase subunit SecF [bacterium]|nr:protein translocase subunit SecF [bacterium]
MRIIGDTNIQFLKYRGPALVVSMLIILVGVGYQFFGPGLNLGIDFVGGTQVTLKFNEDPDLGELRGVLESIGEATVQRFDEAEKHEVLIRVQNPEELEIEDSEASDVEAEATPEEQSPEAARGDFTSTILTALGDHYNQEIGERFDLNTKGARDLLDRLRTADPDEIGFDVEAQLAHYEPMAEAVLDLRKEQGIFSSIDDLDGITVLSEATRAFIKSDSALGAFSLLGAESVGPAVGADLREKATMAIAFSLVGMMIYIWVRFQLPYGLGAVAALFHDVLISLTALALAQREINLPTVAAILTLVGYSVNDSVVVFDRVRENLRLHRGDELKGLMNRSINQTLSRTLITSGTTMMVVLPLYLFGGDVINTFAFVLLIGIIVGTYSSVFVAAPVALTVSRILVKRKERKRTGRRK